MSHSLPHHIDSTLLTSFRGCGKRFEYESIECLRPRTTSRHLIAGAAFAAALEETYIRYYTDGLPQFEAIDAAREKFAETWGDFPHEPDPSEGRGAQGKSFDNVFRAVIHYFSIWPISADPLKPRISEHDERPGTEFSFAVPLDSSDGFPLHPDGDPFIYVGRFDSFCETKDGVLVIRDEKTSSAQFPSNWSDQFDVRNQFMGYCWGAQLSGFDVQHYTVRGIAILKTKFHEAEANKIAQPFMLERFEIQLRQDLLRLVKNYEEGYFDYNFGDTCTQYGGCPYNSLCSAPNPETWFSDYERARWNPVTRTVDSMEAA